LVRDYNNNNSGSAYVHPKFASLSGADEISAEATKYLNTTLFNKEFFKPCKAMWESVHVNVDGEVFPCMAVSMGNVKEKSLVDVIFSKEADTLRAELRLKGLVQGCNRCGYLSPR
jgi:MoaA/NifB/PqqE/SkfB family radical SAM enzyme